MVTRSLRGASLVCALALSLFARQVHAQGWRAGAVGNVLQLGGVSSCAVTWYDPEIFALPDGSLNFLAQGGDPSQVCSPQGTPGTDAFFAGHWSPVSQTWTTPALAACPLLRGFYMLGGYAQNCVYSQTAEGPIASPSVVKIGSRYFMAFVGGNADQIEGRIYWAVSSDGVSWSVFNTSPPAGLAWKPIIAPKYGDPCAHFGIGQVALSYDAADTSLGASGTFYIHFLYDHSTPAHELDTEAYRFAYNPADMFGLPAGFSTGSTPGQICVAANNSPTATCSWFGHSGQLVWDYDGQPVVPGDPLLYRYMGMRQLQYGGLDIKYDPVHGNWLHVYSFGDGVSWQTASSLASSVWTDAQAVDLTAMDATLASRYSAYSNERYYGGLWYGSYTGRTGMWLFQPVDVTGCTGPFQGLGIVPTELCTTSPPAISSVSPATGSAGGGRSVTIAGNNLDCASTATFGGTAGTIVSKSSGSVTVTAPAHLAGTVDVAVTTPAGTATQTGGLTFTSPIYEGYDESLDCNATGGWAWDKNYPNDPIFVSVYDGTTLLGSLLANVYRQDLFNAGKGNGYHGFGFNLPTSVRDGGAHSISIKFGSSATNLTWSPRSVTCKALTVSEAGTGTGTVTSNPGGISCGGSCQAYYPVNTTVALTASPGAGSAFGGWSGAADCSDGTVTMNGNVACTATFNPVPVTAHVIWMQPQATAGFGTPGSLVIAGSATGAPAGTTVRFTWRDATLNGPWTTEPYQPTPDSNGNWFHEILNANYSHQYAVYATYATTTSPICTYPGSGTMYWCQ
jgi:hypothetical protein